MINYYFQKRTQYKILLNYLELNKIYQNFSSFHFQTNFTCFASYHFFYFKKKRTKNLIHHMNNPYSLSLIMFFNKFLIIDDQRINAQTAIKKKIRY